MKSPKPHVPVLRHIANLWTLVWHPSKSREWPLERKLRAVKDAGFDGFTTQLTQQHAKLADKLGFEPPLASLRYWVLGVPDPAAPASVQLDSEQRLTGLMQDGWRVDYGAYMPVGAEWLPRLMTLQREGVRVRMVVDGWQL